MIVWLKKTSICGNIKGHKTTIYFVYMRKLNNFAILHSRKMFF
jgi:hypothetical protein